MSKLFSTLTPDVEVPDSPPAPVRLRYAAGPADRTPSADGPLDKSSAYPRLRGKESAGGRAVRAFGEGEVPAIPAPTTVLPDRETGS